MNKQNACTLSVAKPALAFLGLMGIVTALAAANGMGFVEAAAARRGTGLVIGVMVVLIGNFLPKMRPLNSPGGDAADGIAAERSAGWILVGTGIVYIALFLFAPLEVARPVSSLFGISALVAIALNWGWLLAATLFNRSRVANQRAAFGELSEKRKVVFWLLFAFAYVLGTACVKFLFDSRPWVKDMESWIVLAFGTTYAVIYGILESRRSR